MIFWPSKDSPLKLVGPLSVAAILAESCHSVIPICKVATSNLTIPSKISHALTGSPSGVACPPPPQPGAAVELDMILWPAFLCRSHHEVSPHPSLSSAPPLPPPPPQSQLPFLTFCKTTSTGHVIITWLSHDYLCLSCCMFMCRLIEVMWCRIAASSLLSLLLLSLSCSCTISSACALTSRAVRSAANILCRSRSLTVLLSLTCVKTLPIVQHASTGLTDH